jgi:hypothetical protein
MAAFVALGTQSAVAQTATDLQCTKCVEKRALARSAVGTGKLEDGAVTPRKLHSGIRDRLDSFEASQQFVAVTGAAFFVETGAARFSATGAVSQAQEDDTTLLGSVQLPHGMQVTSFKCLLRDDSEVGQIHIYLLRGPMTADGVDAGNSARVAQIRTHSESARLLDVTGAVAEGNSIVDNRLFAYFLWVNFSGDGKFVEDLLVRGCTIGLSR